MTRELRTLCFALSIFSGSVMAEPAVMLVEHAGTSAAFRIDGSVKVVAVGDAIAGTTARVRYVNAEGVVLELPGDAGQPGALLRLRRGDVLKVPAPPKQVLQAEPVLSVRRVAAPASKQDADPR